MVPQIYRFVWQDIEIKVIYKPLMWGIIAHLEIETVKPERAPLPITETGYRSHFHQPDTIEALGGDVVAHVIAWLNEEAAKPAWQDYIEASTQGDLFDF